MARTDMVDPLVVEAICQGRIPDRRPSYSDRVAACRRLAADGYSDGQIATLIRITPRSVLRMRETHGIPGQRKGLNGYTRKHPTPNPVKRRNAK